MNAHFFGNILTLKRFSTSLEKTEGISLVQEIDTFVSDYDRHLSTRRCGDGG